MTLREPIHLGGTDQHSTGDFGREPILLIHPFMCSQEVWRTTAGLLADTGRFEVFAPTMAGHHGGPPATYALNPAIIADHIERQLDELGWPTAHVVGNSLGGWLAFELEQRGRARSVTAIAPAGGWGPLSPTKFEVTAKFVAFGPALLATRLFGPRILDLPFARQLATLALSGTADGPSTSDLWTLLDDATHCPAYVKLAPRATFAGGLTGLDETRAPVQLVTCERDRLIPAPRFAKRFAEELPPSTTFIRLEQVGHIPMLEAPGRVAELIIDFVDKHSHPQQRVDPTG